MPKAKKYNAISLFSGAMGLDIGIESTGRFEILACVEKDKDCLETIKHNINLGNTSSKKITLFEDINELQPRDMLKSIKKQREDIDLIIGGPPCQSFSTAGRRGTIQDARGTLLWDFHRFVREIRPPFFLMENVRGLLSAAIKHRPIAKRVGANKPLNDHEKPRSVINLLLADYENIGYRVDVFEVNAVNYGSPQLRERVLLIGNKFNLKTTFPPPSHVSPEEYKRTKKQKRLDDFTGVIKPWRTLGDALHGLKDEKPVIVDFSPRKKEFLAMISPGGNWRALPVKLQKESMGKAFYAKGGRSGWWRRLSYDLPCPCLLTLPNHASTSLCHPEEVRALSLKEYLRIQEFPDEWELVGKPTELYRQVGNAVPVRLGLVSGEVIANQLDSLREQNGLTEVNPGGKVIPSKVIYVKSHIRTRRWYKDGKAVINGNATNGSE